MTGRIHINRACHALAAGGVVAYPTEAVWGLGCEPLNRHACARLLALKRRAAQKGFILIAAEVEHVRPYFAPLTEARLAPALNSWPGPSTWLVPAAGWVPPWLTGGHETLAVRVSAHPVSAALCRAYGGPLISTSANIAGRTPARTALQVRCRFGPMLDYLLPGDTGGLGRPTAIRDLRTGKLVRP